MLGATYGSDWRRVRDAVLDESRVCAIRGPKCTRFATEVDHIIPVDAGGPRLDRSNLRPACRACNAGRAGSEKANNGWRRSKCRILLVVGPPGAGKSTLVRDRATVRDVIVDYDEISKAFGPELPRGSTQRHDVASIARGAVLTKLRRGEVDAEHAWIISTNPNAEGMFPHHEVVIVDPGIETVLERAAAAGRPPYFVRLIQDWYARRAGGTGASREW